MDRNADKINALNSRYGVVPYVGTWIEICTITRSARLHNSRSLRGNVDRNDYYWPVFSNIGGRSLRGNVDRNAISFRCCFSRCGRSLRGNVDRNFLGIDGKVRSRHHVVPYVGTWIEMIVSALPPQLTIVVPYVGTWIEMVRQRCSITSGLTSFPTWERG